MALSLGCSWVVRCGNLIDRLRYGYVIDFLYVELLGHLQRRRRLHHGGRGPCWPIS